MAGDDLLQAMAILGLPRGGMALHAVLGPRGRCGKGSCPHIEVAWSSERSR
jgi:hypothetical protein